MAKLVWIRQQMFTGECNPHIDGLFESFDAALPDESERDYCPYPMIELSDGTTIDVETYLQNEQAVAIADRALAAAYEAREEAIKGS